MTPQQNGLLVQKRTAPLIAASLILGMGLGGVFEGIFFNQLLQWHQVISARIPPDTISGKTLNNFWDGVYHSITWLLTGTGIFLLWSLVGRNDVARSNRVFFGGVALGWGIFILLEGIANHYLLSLHHVNESSAYRQWWDHGYVFFGLLIGFGGWYTIRHQKQEKAIKQPVRPFRKIYPVQYIKSNN